MKKTVVILIAVLLLTSLFGCQRSEASSDGLKIVTTIFPTYDFAKSIVGDGDNITLLLKAGSEPHSYEPTPQDIIKIRECDVFVYIGGHSDEWVDSVLASVDTEKMQVVTLIDCVEPISDGHGHANGITYDEHIWTSPVNAVRMTEKIADAISAADPENAEKYAENKNSYIDKLNELDTELRLSVSKGKRRTLIFGDRFPFAYLAKEYGLTCHAAFPGCSEESEVSAAVVAELVKIVRDENIPIVFQLEMSSGRAADSICAETGARKLTLHSCNNVTKDEFESGEGYISLMKKNIEALNEALN